MAGRHGEQRVDDVSRIVASVAISALGTWSYNVGIAVYAYQETQSTAWVAVATVGRYIPAVLITWLGSRVADRYPRRAVAVSADLFCAVVMALLTVVALVHGPLVVAILLAAASSGVARVQNSAALAVAADVVTESRLARTATLISTSEAVATAVGPALASFVLTVSAPPILFALNGLTFALSAILLLSASSASRAALPDLGSGDEGSDDTYRSAVRLVRPLLVTRAIAAVVYGLDIVLLAVIATDRLTKGTSSYGLLLAAAGVGGLLAAALLRRGDAVRGTVLTATAGLVLYAVPLTLFLASPGLGEGLAIQLVRGLGCVLVTATVIAGLQRGVPAAVSTRVFSLTHIVVLVGTSTGAVLAPVLLSWLGLDTTILVAAVVPLALQVAATPALRRFDQRGAAELAALDPRVEVLRGLTLFHDASRSTLYDVADGAVERTVGTGEAIVRQGEHAAHLYVLVSGRVDVTVVDEHTQSLLRTMSAPSYFGEIGLLHRVPRTATVTAIEPCVVWEIPAALFLSAASQAGLSSALTENVRVRFTSSPALARSSEI